MLYRWRVRPHVVPVENPYVCRFIQSYTSPSRRVPVESPYVCRFIQSYTPPSRPVAQSRPLDLLPSSLAPHDTRRAPRRRELTGRTIDSLLLSDCPRRQFVHAHRTTTRRSVTDRPAGTRHGAPHEGIPAPAFCGVIAACAGLSGPSACPTPRHRASPPARRPESVVGTRAAASARSGALACPPSGRTRQRRLLVLRSALRFYLGA
jgi:hypothetical protein